MKWLQMTPTAKADARVPAFTYLRTSSDDGKKKAGIPVQRCACAEFIENRGFCLVQEFADDGTVTGKLHMYERPAGSA